MVWVSDDEAELVEGYRQEQADLAKKATNMGPFEPEMGPFEPSTPAYKSYIPASQKQQDTTGLDWFDAGGVSAYHDPKTGNTWGNGLWYDPGGNVWNDDAGAWQTPQEYNTFWSDIYQHDAGITGVMGMQAPESGPAGYDLFTDWSALTAPEPEMGPFEPYSLDFKQPSPILTKPWDLPFGMADRLIDADDDTGWGGPIGKIARSGFDAYSGILEKYAMPGTEESRQQGIEEQGGLGTMLARPAMGLVSGNQNIEGLTFGKVNPEELPYGLGYLTDAIAAPINWAAAAAGPSMPFIGSTLGGNIAKRAAGEIGIDIGARLLSEQAAGERGEAIPFFGDQPAWLRALEGGLVGGMGAAGAIKGADVGIPAIPGLARQLDAGVNRMDDVLAGGYYGALGMDETLTPGTFRGAGSQVGATGESGMVFATGRKANMPERTVIPDSGAAPDVRLSVDDYTKRQIIEGGETTWTIQDADGTSYGALRFDPQRGWRAGASDNWHPTQESALDEFASKLPNVGQQPLANERLWFHSTRDMKYDLPDPDLAVGTQTGITQGPGIYMAADPAKSAGNYGPRTFVTEFDGKVLDLTRQVTPDMPVFEGGPSWIQIRDSLAAKLDAAGMQGGFVRDAFEGVNLDQAQYAARAELAAMARNADGTYVANGYVYKEALIGALEATYDQRGLRDMLGRFGTLPESMSGSTLAHAVVQNHLAENGVDALFHHSPHADGDVLIVLNGSAARVVADVKNAPDAVKAGSTLKDIRRGAAGKIVESAKERGALTSMYGDPEVKYLSPTEAIVTNTEGKQWHLTLENGKWGYPIEGRPNERMISASPEQMAKNMGTASERVQKRLNTWQPASIRTFRDLIDDETGSVNIGMFAEAGPVARKRILDQLADRATREGRPTGGIFDDILPTEKIETGIVRMYEGRTGTAGLELQRDLDNGNRLLQDLRIGRRNGRLVNVERTPEIEDLFKALHGEGVVPPRLKQVFDDVKRMIAEESNATLRDNPEFVMKDDYFYRGWRAPKETKAGVGRGQVGAKPGYQKPRVDATFSELLDEGWEPLSWNPYEMAALRRNAGVQFREQKQLVESFKQTGIAVAVDAATPDGYRVPRIGPAFEGKPFAFIPGAEPLSDAVGARVGYTPRYAVPNKVADQLENIFGRKPDSGFLGTWAKGNAKLKQTKLLFSLFQQVDFATRQLGSGFAGAIDDILSGKPLSAVKKVITVPSESAKLFTANVSGARQASLRDSILSTRPLFNERPGVSLRSISDAGWNTSDISIINTSIKRALDDIAKGGNVGPVKGALRSAGGEGAITGAPLRRWKMLNEASQKGLFEGVYPQAQVSTLKRFIVPRLMRQHPDWTDAQISAAAATEINKLYSSLGNFQQTIKNPVSKEFIQSLVFSTNETESLLKQAASTVIGPNKLLWTEYYLGGFVALATVANLVHFAATGEPLPLDRYKPIKKDGFGPLPIGYNSQFLSPQVPFLRGRNDTPIDVDLMGQMDTVFRLLDPQGFIEARENVGLRALQSQQSGEDFFGRPLDGPKERMGQLAADLAEPIGVSQFRGALDIGPEGEGRLGNIGQALQGTGINLRGETTANMKDRKAAEYHNGAKWSELTKDQRDELIAKDADLRNEMEARRDEAAASGQQWAINQTRASDATEQAMTYQMGSDQRLLSGEITPEEWRAALSDRQLELRTIKGTIYGNAGTKQGEDPVLDAYFRAMDDAVRKDDGTFDGAKFGAYIDTLSQKDLDYIASQTGVSLNTALVQQWRHDVKLLSDSGYFDAENKVAVRKADPEIAVAVRRWGYSEMSVKAEDVVLKYTAQQEVDDRALEQGQITPAQWHDNYNKRRDQLRAEKDGIYAGMKDDGVATDPLDAYFSEIDKAVKPNGIDIDWTRVDAWVAQQPADVQEVINTYVSPGLTPVVDQYKAAVNEIEESGYWTINDKVTAYWAKANGIDYPEGTNADAFWGEIQQEVYTKVKAKGYSTIEAQSLTNVVMGQLQKDYLEVAGKVRAAARDSSPELTRLLVSWGFWEPGKKDTAELLAAGTLR